MPNLGGRTKDDKVGSLYKAKPQKASRINGLSVSVRLESPCSMDRQLVCLAVSVLYKEMGKRSRKATSPRVVPQSPHESHEIWYSVHAQS